MRRWAWVVICLLVVSLLLSADDLVEMRDGVWWTTLLPAEKHRWLEGYKTGTFMAMRTFRLAGYQHTTAYQLLLPAVDGTPTTQLINEVDTFYRNPANRTIPVFAAIIQARRHNDAKRLVPGSPDS